MVFEVKKETAPSEIDELTLLTFKLTTLLAFAIRLLTMLLTLKMVLTLFCWMLFRTAAATALELLWA